MAAFVGAVLYNEITLQAQVGALLEQEQFVAVGQWSCVAVVVLVLLAAVVSRIFTADERNGGVENVPAEGIRVLEKGNEKLDEEWNCGVGYAS